MIKLFGQNNTIKCYKCNKNILTNKIKIFNFKIYHKYCFNKIYRINKYYGIYKNKDSKNKTILSHKILDT